MIIKAIAAFGRRWIETFAAFGRQAIYYLAHYLANLNLVNSGRY